jgi:hypothetical protein
MLMAKCISPASPDWISARVKFVHGSETTSDLTFSNLALGDSGEGGIKVGYYLPREWVWNILGVEGELYYHSPTIKAQTSACNRPVSDRSRPFSRNMSIPAPYFISGEDIQLSGRYLVDHYVFGVPSIFSRFYTGAPLLKKDALVPN